MRLVPRQLPSFAVDTLTLDCDVLTVDGVELQIMIYSAESGTADADKLPLPAVIGLHSPVG